MHLSSRKQEILDILKKEKNIKVNALIEHFEVAPATIRRDIASLVESGLITRTHGEVHILDTTDVIPSIDARSCLHLDEKNAIGAFAKSLIAPGSLVVLDSGTTTLALAQQLMNDSVTIITNSLDISRVLAKSNGTTICSGGMLEPSHMCFLGPDAEYFFSRHEVDILFLGTTGVSKSAGFTTSSPLQYNLKQVMLQNAKKKYVLCDLSKLHSANLYVFAEFTDVNGIVTTRPAHNSYEQDFLSHLEKCGIPIFYA